MRERTMTAAGIACTNRSRRLLRGVSSLAEAGAEGWILGDDAPEGEGFGMAGLGLSD